MGRAGTRYPRPLQAGHELSSEGRVRAREQRAVYKETQGDEKGYLNKHWAVPMGPPSPLGFFTECPGKSGSCFPPLTESFRVAGGRWQAAVGSTQKGRNPLISLVITATYGFAQLHSVNWLLQASQTDWAERLGFNPFAAPRARQPSSQSTAVSSCNLAGSYAKDQQAWPPAPSLRHLCSDAFVSAGDPQETDPRGRNEAAPQNIQTPQPIASALGLQQTHHVLPGVPRDCKLTSCLFSEGDPDSLCTSTLCPQAQQDWCQRGENPPPSLGL